MFSTSNRFLCIVSENVRNPIKIIYTILKSTIKSIRTSEFGPRTGEVLT